jgi:hypothetical protein
MIKEKIGVCITCDTSKILIRFDSCQSCLDEWTKQICESPYIKSFTLEEEDDDDYDGGYERDLFERCDAYNGGQL